VTKPLFVGVDPDRPESIGIFITSCVLKLSWLKNEVRLEGAI
jgi:hypothetical protein